MQIEQGYKVLLFIYIGKLCRPHEKLLPILCFLCCFHAFHRLVLCIERDGRTLC